MQREFTAEREILSMLILIGFAAIFGKIGKKDYNFPAAAEALWKF